LAAIVGIYQIVGNGALFWSSTEDDSYSAWNRQLYYYTSEIYRPRGHNELGLSVRCVKGEAAMSPPTVTTSSITDITTSSATDGGNVTSDGGASVTARGVCWSISPNPTISDNHTDDGYGTGSFTSSITGLYPGTHYYVRAYATNSEGAGYGIAITFTTQQISHETGTFTDIRDGRVYKTVKIDDQWWFAENLNYKTNSGSWVYDNDLNNVEIYGRLYNWATANTACPEGWHLPSDDEWKKLEIYLGMSEEIANRTGWRGDNVDTELKEGGNSGFEVLFGGYYYPYGIKFGGKGSKAAFWLSNDAGFSTWHRRLSDNETRVLRSMNYNCVKPNAFSVRPIKD